MGPSGWAWTGSSQARSDGASLGATLSGRGLEHDVTIAFLGIIATLSVFAESSSGPVQILSAVPALRLSSPVICGLVLTSFRRSSLYPLIVQQWPVGPSVLLPLLSITSNVTRFFAKV